MFTDRSDCPQGFDLFQYRGFPLGVNPRLKKRVFLRASKMIFRQSSIIVKALLFLASPAERLPQLFPLTIMRARVGNNMVDYVKVTFKWVSK